MVFCTTRTVLHMDDHAEAGADGDENLPCLIDPDHTAYVIFTSGSTGRPKGVMVTHRGPANLALWCIRHYGLTEGDRALGFISLSFDASVEEIFPALTSGATLVVHPSPSSVGAAEMLAFCRDQGISILHFPAAYWHQLVADAASARLRVPASVRLTVVGGEAPSGERIALSDSPPIRPCRGIQGDPGQAAPVSACHQDRGLPSRASDT